MKTILCYGDSNTWGYSPATQDRYGRDERWTGVLRNEIGEGYLVIEKGLGGRTTVWDDPVEGRHKNGETYLLPCLESHQPIDLVIILLGTNDLKRRFCVGAFDIAQGAGGLVRIVQKSETGPTEKPHRSCCWPLPGWGNWRGQISSSCLPEQSKNQRCSRASSAA